MTLNYDYEIAPYRKRAVHSSPKKADHKHTYKPCIFEYQNVRFDNGYGYIPQPRVCFGTYCTICGKIGSKFDYKEWTQRKSESNGGFTVEYTAEAQSEINPATRKLPTFQLIDIWKQKNLNPDE